MNMFGGPIEIDPVYCDRRCRFNPNGVCTKKAHTRISDTARCGFFARESREDDEDA